MVIKNIKLVLNSGSKAKSEQYVKLLAEYLNDTLGGKWQTRVWYHVH